MINFKYVNKYCCEDLRLIENYEQAVNGPEIWDCHHRKETDLGLSKIELIEQRLYFNRPAAELIFLTRSEHTKIHMTGENHPMYCKNSEDYMTEEAIKEKRQKQSIAGKKRYKDPKERKKTGDVTRNCPWMNNGVTECRPKTQEEIYHYINLGYKYGRLPFRK